LDEISHSVSEARPSLLPLLRSKNQLDLLAALVLAPTCVWSITELAARLMFFVFIADPTQTCSARRG
jgi:hypothetical protein